MSNKPKTETQTDTNTVSGGSADVTKLSVRLLVFFVAGSLILSIFITGVQIFAHYRDGIAEIEDTLDLIEKVYTPAIANSLFAINEPQLQLQLTGLIHFRDIVHVEVVEDKDTFHFRRSAGDPGIPADRVRTFPLAYEKSGLGAIFLGNLNVAASFDGLKKRLLSNGVIIAMSTLSQVALMGFLAYLIIHFTVTRHLVHLSAYADTLEARTLDKPVRLRRSSLLKNKSDEIDRLALAIDNLRRRIQADIAHREAVKEELEAGKARFQSLTDNLPVGVYRLSPKGDILFVNPALVAMFGYDSADELTGMPAAMLYADIRDLKLVMDVYTYRSITEPVEVQLLKKDGSAFWASFRATRLEDEAGDLLALDGTIEDITARKQAEIAVQKRTGELESLYRLSQEIGANLSLDGIFRIAIDHLRKTVSAHLIVLFLRNGVDLELKARAQNGLPAVWDDTVCHQVGKCLCGLAAEERTSLYCSDIQGDPRCVLLECKNAGLRSFAAIPLESGKDNLGILGIGSLKRTDFSLQASYLETAAHTIAIGIRNGLLYRDVEDHARQLETRLAELEASKKALRESEHRFRSFFNSSPEGVVLVDFEGRIQEINRSLRQATGSDDNDLTGLDLTRLVSDGHREQIDTIIGGVRKGFLSESPAEMEFLRRDGSGFPAVVRTWLVSDEAGRSLALGVFVKDITSEKELAAQKSELERQLQQTQKMEAIGTLAGGIAHDFNNILGGIIGYVELAIQFAPPSGDRLLHYLYRTLEAGNRAKDLVEQILKFSRQNPVTLQSYALTPLLKEVVQFLRSTMPAFIEIRSDLTAETDRVMADISQIHQVVMNLCTNAYHAMRQTGGVLTLAMRTTRIDTPRKFLSLEIPGGDYVRITVSDTGPGIPAHARDRIFEPYFTTKKQNEGTGLGLAVTFGIVKNHNGLIEFESRAGNGAVFTVFLPVSEHTTAEAGLVEAPAPAGQGERVMIVDDELFFLEVLKEHLESLNYDVVALQSSAKALQSFKAAPDYFDLVITDQTMPEMTGVQLISEIRTRRADIPIILCTGFSETVTELSAAHYGISKFLMKPVHRVVLAQSVYDLLAERRHHGQHSRH